MSLTNDAVVKRFREKRAGNGANMSTDGTVLKSYAAVIAQWIVDREGNEVVIHNSDRFSITTSQHQNHAKSEHREEPEVSFSALRAAGLTAPIFGWSRELRSGVRVVASSPSRYGPSFWDKEPKEPVEPIIGATLFQYHAGQLNWHRPKAAILEFEDYQYFCSSDEGRDFVAKLPVKVNTVEEGYLALMPKEVIGKEYLRQGEWFFVEAEENISMTTFRMASWVAGSRSIPLGLRSLPYNDGSNPHKPTYFIEHNGRLLVGGTIRHSQHRMLRLKKKTIYAAYKSRSLANYSAARGGLD